MPIERKRRAMIQRATIRECAQIIEAAIGVDLGIHSELATSQEESELIETTMRKISDYLYKRADL